MTFATHDIGVGSAQRSEDGSDPKIATPLLAC